MRIASALVLLALPLAAQAEQTCTWTAQTEATVSWTAFKFTEKVGVSGTFKEVAVSDAKAADTPLGALGGLSASIATGSVDTGNAERDSRISQILFGTMSDTAMMQAKLTSTTELESGVELSLTMNGETHVVPLVATVGNETIELKGTVDLAVWNANSAVDALNAVCKELHTGVDGVTKLWTTVAVTAAVPVKQTCK